MKKKSTQNLHNQIVNDVMYYVYDYIDTDINIDELADNFGVSRFHLHKVFKEQMGKNIYETIKSIRLQKASYLLLTNKSSTITEISNMCGYSSQTSFIRVFKERFNQTPKIWRNGGFKDYSREILKNSKYNFESLEKFKELEVKIVKAKPERAYYIRHKGYDAVALKRVWQKILAWTYTNNLKNYQYIGVYHDNPIITPHDECFYVAAVIPREGVDLSNTNLPSFITPEILYATFDFKGKVGDLAKLIRWAYHEWLPKSGFETTTNPSFSIFRENHYLSEKREFDVTYHLPIMYS